MIPQAVEKSVPEELAERHDCGVEPAIETATNRYVDTDRNGVNVEQGAQLTEVWVGSLCSEVCVCSVWGTRAGRTCICCHSTSPCSGDGTAGMQGARFVAVRLKLHSSCSVAWV